MNLIEILNQEWPEFRNSNNVLFRKINDAITEFNNPNRQKYGILNPDNTRDINILNNCDFEEWFRIYHNIFINSNVIIDSIQNRNNMVDYLFYLGNEPINDINNTSFVIRTNIEYLNTILKAFIQSVERNEGIKEIILVQISSKFCSIITKIKYPINYNYYKYTEQKNKELFNYNYDLFDLHSLQDLIRYDALLIYISPNFLNECFDLFESNMTTRGKYIKEWIDPNLIVKWDKNMNKIFKDDRDINYVIKSLLYTIITFSVANLLDFINDEELNYSDILYNIWLLSLSLNLLSCFLLGLCIIQKTLKKCCNRPCRIFKYNDLLVFGLSTIQFILIFVYLTIRNTISPYTIIFKILLSIPTYITLLYVYVLIICNIKIIHYGKKEDSNSDSCFVKLVENLEEFIHI